jgi:hypothetical protein
MSYLLIGNISALNSDNYIQPPPQAHVRVYLPDDSRYGIQASGLLLRPEPLQEETVTRKGHRLLATTSLDEQGDFSLSWEQCHLFTEALELDITLGPDRHFHLGALAFHWKRTRDKYLAAFAYVIPAGQLVRKDITSGAAMPLRHGQYEVRPDVYFRVYKNQQLFREEDPRKEDHPERRAIAPCTLLNITSATFPAGRTASRLS